MKRSLLTLLFFSLFAFSALAQAPSWAKKATKAVFTLKTFAPNGDLLSSANGFFVGQQGEAVAPYAPFRGASRAVVIDADGKEWAVECMLGANETYDVAKFRVNSKKTISLAHAATQPVGTTAWLLPYREVKQMPKGIVRKVETFHTQYPYYTLSMQMPESAYGSPLLSQQGEVIGIMQRSTSASDTLSYAVSARYADSLSISGLSINDPVLRAVHIKKALPADLAQAQLTLYLATSSLDSASYAQLVGDFIEQFPTAPDGYQYRAQLYFSGNDFDNADKCMRQAIDVAAQKDEAHYGLARMIYQKMLLKPTIAYDPWTLDLALQEAEEAYRINPQPIYQQQQAQVLFAQQQYDRACELFLGLTTTSLRSPDLFYEASRCKEMQADTTAQLALLDSAVAMFSRPYLREAAPYLLTRAQARLNAGKYRDATFDLNEYETLMRSQQLTANFYYLRYQAEVGGRLFQQALNDIDRAIELNDANEFYLAEKASLQIRVGLVDEAMVTAQQLIDKAPSQSDGYLFLGLAQCLADKKSDGLKNLEKARDMGDTQAQMLIDKYAK